jgi:DnaK suppressor protein
MMALAKEELDTLLRSLQARARALRGEISSKLGDAADDAGGMNTGGDYGDQAYASGESSLDLAEAGRDIEEMRAIDAAVRAIEEGSYGFCASCGDEIPGARLKAQPLAIRCVACQERAERGRAEQRPSI